MSHLRHLTGGLVCLALCAGAAHAEAPPAPLNLLPAEADLLVQVRQPRRLVEALASFEAIQQLRQVPAARNLLDSTNLRRAKQLVGYFERELGAPWPELVDRLAGHGAAAALLFQSLHADKAKFGATPTPALLVVQGKDEKLVQKFAKLGLAVLEQELARKENAPKAEKRAYHGIETVHLGNDFHAAVVGPAILIANREKMLHRGLDLHRGSLKSSLADSAKVADAGKLLPEGPLATVWVNMERVQQSPEGKKLYKSPRDNGNLTGLVGAILDVLGRTPFVAAGLYREEAGFLLTARMPRGRAGMGADSALHLPPLGKPGSRPLLEPKDVVFSSSFYLNVPSIWEDRAKLFNEKQAKALEQFDKTSARFLIGTKMSKLLTQAGPYQRFVAVNQAKVPYKTQPKTPIGAFALVTELREPEAFAKSMNAVLRGAAFLASFQVKLKLVEETYNGCKIVGYRFPEDAVLKVDVNDLRFNFSPCFVRVGDQFVLCSTLELCREMIDVLKKEGTAPDRGAASTERMRFYAAGVADSLVTGEDTLIAQTILDQAVSPEEARQQARAFAAWVRRLGTLTQSTTYTDNEFHYDIRLKTAK
jgi:hypothetical protein